MAAPKLNHLTGHDRAERARRAAEKVGRDVRAVSRRKPPDAARDIPILAEALSDLAESVVGLAYCRGGDEQRG
jgi:hypothetical protein